MLDPQSTAAMHQTSMLYVHMSRLKARVILISLFYSPAAHRLVLASRRLARLKLVQVPSADGQAALVLIHASSKVVDVGLADLGGLVTAVHGVLAVLCLGDRLGRSSLCCRSGRATAEPAAYCVADGRADRDTTESMVSMEIGRIRTMVALTLQCWPSGRRAQSHRRSAGQVRLVAEELAAAGLAVAGERSWMLDGTAVAPEEPGLAVLPVVRWAAWALVLGRETDEACWR